MLLIFLLIVVGLPVASFIGTANSFPLMFAIAGVVWYVHSRMLANVKDAQGAPES